MYQEPSIESSYRENNLGRDIYKYVYDRDPVNVVEFGCLYGYSSVCIAQALRDRGRGTLHIHDIWSDYPYKAADFLRVYNNLCDFGLIDYVKFHHTDFFEWIKIPTHFNILHLDISNTGHTLLQTVYALGSQIDNGASILFEGGSVERDQVDWMEKHDKIPMTYARDMFDIWYNVLNLDFPSISYIDKDSICF